MKAARIVVWLCFGILSAQAICAQVAVSASVAPLDVQRKIELMIRLQYEVPTACDIQLGQRTPSSFKGYDKLQVTLSQGGRSTVIDFLISTDDKTLARMDSSISTRIQLFRSTFKVGPCAEIQMPRLP
jgi:hypothetical protein